MLGHVTSGAEGYIDSRLVNYGRLLSRSGDTGRLRFVKMAFPCYIHLLPRRFCLCIIKSPNIYPRHLLSSVSTITPVTSIICIPLPIGVLGKRGTLEDKNTNDKCHGREWWVGKNQKYLVFNLNHLVKSQLYPLCLLTMFVSKRGRCFITLLDVTGDSTITPVTSIICISLPIGVLGKRGSLRIITPVTDCLFVHIIISFLLTLPKLKRIKKLILEI